MREMITNKARVLSILAGSVGKDYNIPVSSNFREPDMDPIARDRTLAGDDGIHPSDAGYALAFERIQALL